jgi:hypothetical protein
MGFRLFLIDNKERTLLDWFYKIGSAEFQRGGNLNVYSDYYSSPIRAQFFIKVFAIGRRTID